MPKIVLTEENLARHTEHQKKLTIKRDFVAEFINGLVPTVPPRLNPIRSTRLSDDENTLRKIQPKTEEADPEPLLSRHQALPLSTPVAKASRVEGRDARAVVDLTKDFTAVGRKKRPRKESVATTPTRSRDGPRQAVASHMKPKDSLIAATNKNNHNHSSSHSQQDKVFKSKSKRKSAVTIAPDTSDLDVENLVINDSASNPVGVQQAKTNNSFVLDDQRESFSQRSARENHEGGRDRQMPLKERVNKEDKSQHDVHQRRHYRHQHHQQQQKQQQQHHHHNQLEHHPDRHDHQHRSKARPSDEPRIVKSNRNKPRKILTQGSLVMNQFKSSKIAKKSRITIPGVSRSLGIFKKGKASKKVAVNKVREFSENLFLNQQDTGEEVDGSRNAKIVTSDYFTPQNKTQDKDEEVSTGSDPKIGTNTISTGSEHSYHSLQLRRKRKANRESVPDTPRGWSKKRRGQRAYSIQSGTSHEEHNHGSELVVTEESLQVSYRSSDNIPGSPPEGCQNGDRFRSYPPESTMDHQRQTPGQLYDPDAHAVQEQLGEPLQYYIEASQDYVEYYPALYSYLAPIEYPSDLLPASSTWSEPWPQDTVLPQYSQPQAEVYLQSQEILQERDLEATNTEESDAFLVKGRAYTHPPQAQFQWRPRRLY